MSEKILVISPKGEEKYMNTAVWRKVKQSSQFAGWTAAEDYEGGNTDKVITKLPPEVAEMQRRMMEANSRMMEDDFAQYVIEVKQPEAEVAEAPVEVELPKVKEPETKGKAGITHLVDMVKPVAKKPDSGKPQPVVKKNPGK
jgi:hypothetical protein